MNNDTGGDRPMPGTRMRRLFDENLSMIETMTRIEIRRLGRMPRGTHLGQDDGNPVTDLLPDRYLDRYDREFLYRMLGAAIRLRARLADPTANHAAHSVIEEILISRAIRLIADDDNEEGSGLEAWLEDWLGDLDIDRLYDPAADEATLASDPATGSGDMRFDHWFEDQYWADETDGGMMDDERRKAILLALACLAILILLIIECAIMPRMGWLWIVTAALDLVLLAMCVRHIIRGGRK